MQYFNGYYCYPNAYDNELFIRKGKEKSDLKFIGCIVGGAVLLYTFIQEALGLTAFIEGIKNAYLTNYAFRFLFSIISSIVGLFIPFLIAGLIIGKRTGKEFICYDKPVSYSLMFSAVFFGFFVCLASNFITDLFVSYMDSFGFELTSPEFEMPTDVFSRCIYAVAVAVVPAFVEEFAFRGAVMQPLRKYGDGFAIVASSVVFAILHGNLIQAPFALIAGIGMGYAVCLTNSIWTGVIIHFLNNFYSVIMSFMVADITDEEMLSKVYLLITVSLYAISILGSVVFVILRRNRKLAKAETLISSGEKSKAFFLNVPMIIAFIIMLIQITNYVTYTG